MSKLKLTAALADVPVKPAHPPPIFVFPKWDFGKKVVQRSSQADWFTAWPWLHYRSTDDVVFCHVCITAMKHKGMKQSRGDSSFTNVGFKNWKDATISFRDHQSSVTHKTALQLVVDIPVLYPDVGEMISTGHAKEKRDSRQCLLKILSNVAFLARQGLAFRGDGDESNSNFLQLLKLRGLDDPRIPEWIAKKANKYTSHDIQDELLKVMAITVLRKIFTDLAAVRYFCIMCDECTDAANREKLVVCVRWVDSYLEAHEEFIGLYLLET